MVETNIDVGNMGISADREIEAPLDAQKAMIRFKSEEDDLKAQEILGWKCEIQYLDKGRVVVPRKMLEVLNKNHVQFEPANKKQPSSVEKTLRRDSK